MMMAVEEEARARAGGRRRSTGGSVSSNAVSSSSPRSFSSFFSSDDDDALAVGVGVGLEERAEEERPLRGRKVRVADDDGGDEESTVVIFFFSLPFFALFGVENIWAVYILRALVFVRLSRDRGGRRLACRFTPKKMMSDRHM